MVLQKDGKSFSYFTSEEIGGIFITTEWFEDEYFSEAYGIEENYRDEEGRVKEYVSAEETLDKTYYLSQFKVLKLLIPRILKEKELEK